jgi:hypothetical protein
MAKEYQSKNRPANMVYMSLLQNAESHRTVQAAVFQTKKLDQPAG